MNIQGVLGPIKTEDLGYTLMHEHILAANHTMRKVWPEWYNHEQFLEFAVRMIARAKAQGVKTLVDMTPFQLGRDIHVIREVAEKAEINVIACTGYHYFEDLCLVDKGSGFLAERLILDIEKGIEDTDSKAGIIKCSTDRAGITDFTRRIMMAAVIAHKATGAPISTHTASMQNAIDQMDFFEAEGVDLGKVIIGHIGDIDDVGFLESVADRGCFIGHDRFGVDTRHPDMLSSAKRAENVVQLWKDGYLGKVVFSHDASCYLDYWEGRENMGNPWETTRNTDLETWQFQFDYISRHTLPLLRDAGMTDAEINTILVDTPRRIFEGR